ncbi:MAG: magnesium transporter [bacterium]
MNPRIETIRKQIEKLKSSTDYDGLKKVFEISHPSDLAEALQNYYPAEAAEYVNMMPRPVALEVLRLIPESRARNILKEMDVEDIPPYLAKMNPDDAADIFLEFDSGVQDKILEHMEDDQVRQNLINLISHPSDSAGGLMTTEYIAVSEDSTVKEAIKAAREYSGDAEIVYYIYTLDSSQHLSGVLSMRELIQTDPQKRVEDIVRRDIFKVQVDDDQEEAARLMERYQLLAIPVVDEYDRLRGIITVDDAMDALEDETTEDFYKKSGMSSIESMQTERSHRVINASIWTNILVRAPWLIVVGIGGLFAGGVLEAYEQALETWVVLAFFVPLLMDMGGNVGTQSTTIFVRGLTLGHIDPRHFFKDMVRELVRTGLAIGTLMGVLTFSAGYFWVYFGRGASHNHAFLIGMTVGVSMLLIVCVASMLGYLIPWIIYKINLDPAAVSDPVVTTIKDITGLLIYFSVANLFLVF